MTARAWILWLFWAVSAWAHVPAESSLAGPLAEANSYRFNSKEIQASSGLYCYGFRCYDPTLQRWLTRDPLGEAGGVNLYRFVGNDPANSADPFGLQAGTVGMGNCRPPPCLRGSITEEISESIRAGSVRSGWRICPSEHELLRNTLRLEAEFLPTPPYSGPPVMRALIPRPAPPATSYRPEQTPSNLSGNQPPATIRCSEAAESGAARLGSLTPAQARQIQAFSGRFGAEVNVVGSRAAGTAGALSDFDYVIGGNASLRNSAGYYLPRGAAGGELRGGVETGIDIFNANRTPLDPTRPFIQFTPGQTPVVGPRP